MDVDVDGLGDDDLIRLARGYAHLQSDLTITHRLRAWAWRLHLSLVAEFERRAEILDDLARSSDLEGGIGALVDGSYDPEAEMLDLLRREADGDPDGPPQAPGIDP